MCAACPDEGSVELMWCPSSQDSCTNRRLLCVSLLHVHPDRVVIWAGKTLNLRLLFNACIWSECDWMCLYGSSVMCWTCCWVLNALGFVDTAHRCANMRFISGFGSLGLFLRACSFVLTPGFYELWPSDSWYGWTGIYWRVCVGSNSFNCCCITGFEWLRFLFPSDV